MLENGAATHDIDFIANLNSCLQNFANIPRREYEEKNIKHLNKGFLLRDSISIVYEEGAALLKKVVEFQNAASSSAGSALRLRADQSGSYLMANGTSVFIVQDLVLISNYICSIVRPPSAPSLVSKKPQHRPHICLASVKSALVALSLFWGVAALLSQPARSASSTVATGQCATRSHPLLLAVRYLATESLVYEGAVNVMGEALCELEMLIEDQSAHSHTSRIRVAIQRCFKTPLLFGTILSLSIHGDWVQRVASLGGINPTTAPHAKKISTSKAAEHLATLQQSDRNGIDVVQCLIAAAPKGGLEGDGATNCTPTAIVAAYRNSVPLHGLAPCFSLSLVQVLCRYCASALSIPDCYGLYPLHHAARSGETLVMEFLAGEYGYTAFQRDTVSHRYPLHFAIEHLASHHNEAAVLDLAKVAPELLLGLDDEGVSLVRWAERFCSPLLIKTLRALAEEATVKRKKVKVESGLRDDARTLTSTSKVRCVPVVNSSSSSGEANTTGQSDSLGGSFSSSSGSSGKNSGNSGSSAAASPLTVKSEPGTARLVDSEYNYISGRNGHNDGNLIGGGVSDSSGHYIGGKRSSSGISQQGTRFGGGSVALHTHYQQQQQQQPLMQLSMTPQQSMQIPSQPSPQERVLGMAHAFHFPAPVANPGVTTIDTAGIVHDANNISDESNSSDVHSTDQQQVDTSGLSHSSSRF